MKYFSLSVFFLLLNSIFAVSQSFPTHGDAPEWTFFKCWDDEQVFITTGEDTLIEGKWWIPLDRSDDYWTSPKYYRVDGQKVYFRTEESQSGRKEFLMYDFSMEVGDSVYIGITGSMFLSDSILFKVSSTGMFFFGETPRKYIFGSSSVEAFEGYFVQLVFAWVEGIGDILSHPFYPGYCLFQQDDVFGPCSGCENFTCLSTDESVLYALDDNPFCQYPEETSTRIYVDQNTTTSAQNGSSWQYAFDDLQEAIEMADPGDSIWVAQGTYFPTSDADREVFFHLNPGIKIFGGFNGTETDISQRDWESYETILSGDIGVQGDSTDNSYHVVYTIGTDSTAVLDGFTITRGYAIHPMNGYVGHLPKGGGMVVDTDEEHPEASPTIRNCTFVLNVGRNGGGVACNGVYGRYANPNFYNCRFFNNKGSLYGGAIYKIGPADEASPQKFINCVFEDNWAWQGGAGVFLFVVCNDFYFENCTFFNNSVALGSGAIDLSSSCIGVDLNLKNCHFENNIGTEGAALIFYEFPPSDQGKEFNFYIDNCRFINNSALYGNGGAIILAPYSKCNLRINNCVFEENHSLNAGGAIDLFVREGAESFLDITRSVFSNNYCINTPASGAINIRGEYGSEIPPRSFTTIKNSVFYDNRGALGISSGPGTAETDISHCSFYNNGSYPIAKNWSANFDYVDFYNLMSLNNCVIWEPDITLKNLFYNGSPNNQHLYDYTINNCLISQPACDLPGGDEACNEGMIFGQKPLFVDAENGNLRVGACSPALNAGDNIFSVDLDFDLQDHLRILEGTVDLGAYERETFWLEFASADSVSCPGESDGAVYFETNGDLPLNYFWEMGILADTTATELETGNYIFTVTDATGCADTLDVFVPAVDTLEVDYLVQDASAFDAQDGALILQNISGGTAPFEWLWNTEDTTASIENLFPGWYVLNLLDANDCWYQYNFEVSALDALSVLPEEERPQLFPNPVKQGQAITLLFPKGINKKYTIRVIDTKGREVVKDEKTAGQNNIFELQTEHFSAGVYFVKVENEEGQYYVFRLVLVS